MTDQELKDYAVELILDHAREVDHLCISEAAKDFFGHEITDADFKAVDELIRKATVTVAFPAPSE